ENIKKEYIDETKNGDIFKFSLKINQALQDSIKLEETTPYLKHFVYFQQELPHVIAELFMKNKGFRPRQLLDSTRTLTITENEKDLELKYLTEFCLGRTENLTKRIETETIITTPKEFEGGINLPIKVYIISTKSPETATPLVDDSPANE
ncbi:MAG: hypothetical protein JSS09_07340, partial [Verrucomicrobia bacterium]|nr:hypothetical protein [Verrucomicrobiota bacterium]